MTLHYEDGGLRLFHGSNKDILPTFPDASFDSIVTDPPYELGFMGKGWDSSGIAYDVDVWRECFRVLKPGGYMLAFGGTRTWHRIAVAIEDAGFEIRDSIAWMYGSGFPKSMDVSKAIDKIAFVNDETRRRIALVAEVIRTHREAKGMERTAVSEAVVGTRSGACWNWEHHQLPSVEMWPAIKRVLDIPDKFDGLIAGTREMFIGAEREVIGTRTTGVGTGRGAVAYISDNDNRDITAPATDAAKEWAGWGTALKPAFEPIIVARKPLAGTVAANVLAYGTGAINIDACRVPTGDALAGGRGGGSVKAAHGGWNRPFMDDPDATAEAASRARDAQAKGEAMGRFPSNVLLDESQAAELDRQAPNTGGAGKASGPSLTGASTSVARGKFNGVEGTPFYADSGGASRFFKIIKEEPCATVPENATTLTATTATSATPAPDGTVSAAPPADASGGTSFPPFRYEAKAPGSERPTVDGVAHATVKPLDLMRWLIRLVTRRGGHVLDLFAGSGTTGEAALLEGMECTLIELEADHLPLILARVRKPLQPSMFGDWEVAS